MKKSKNVFLAFCFFYYLYIYILYCSIKYLFGGQYTILILFSVANICIFRQYIRKGILGIGITKLTKLSIGITLYSRIHIINTIHKLSFTSL